MKNIFLVAMLFISSHCIASEEDYAAITMIKLVAKTTENTFGTVEVIADTSIGQEGPELTSLQIKKDKQIFNTPANDLLIIKRAQLDSVRVSSEYGYPSKGFGPYLYISIKGLRNGKFVHFKFVYTSDGYERVIIQNNI